MEKVSLKLQKWTKSDVILNVLTYVLNVGVVILLFIGCLYLNQVMGGQNAQSVLGNSDAVAQFVILVIFIFFPLDCDYLWCST